jgi:methylmalonyl-CoA carboxyltransferase large subunit
MVKVEDLAKTLEQLQAQVAEMSRHIAFLEQRDTAAATAPQAAPPAVREEPAAEGITEAELIAISAALGAYLGVRAHIRQIRLVSTAAWAQQGRVSIQASHRLQG